MVVKYPCLRIGYLAPMGSARQGLVSTYLRTILNGKGMPFTINGRFLVRGSILETK
ncbi:hypothetical protein IMPR6_170065 [Imperialibacter sp. EC-SDR9]|nr:hypothetical protein IMPERIA75_290045 [Imperialibacter sp. 75]CAD5275731.1 hypothetical protein IMPERIA89_400064 [Imperialibacter sp. 89]VVT08408.1 hypothetical protein IMPR6_170065 [Imperialibacter sp. EC-SDR9]